MTSLWTAAEIAQATGGEAFADFAATGVTFDSREVTPGALFIALKGEHTDGHRFVDAAFAAGAAGALVSEPVPHPHVRVPDTMAGLVALGRRGRARATNATVVGVTGSVGKTTTKELIRAAFAAQGPTHASVKSYNNHTGVPLSLARMPPDTGWGVFEMGMNHAGEIAALTRQVLPDVALITWIAPAHIENLGSLEAIARAKAEIFEPLQDDGAAVIPADAPYAELLAKAARARTRRVIGFGIDAPCDVRAEALAETPEGSRFTLRLDERAHDVALRQPGRHRVQNALAAIAAVWAAGADVEPAIAVIGAAGELAGRGARRSVPVPGGTAEVIDESYNANPASMAAALAVLEAARPDGRKLVVLGAMRELGQFSHGYHRDLAPLIEQAGPVATVLVGAETAPLAAALPAAAHVPDWQSALALVKTELRPGDLLLVKGSNSVGLGRLVAALEASDAL